MSQPCGIVKPLACFGVGNVLHLLRGNIELPCKDSPVALCLIEHEDKIAVFKLERSGRDCLYAIYLRLK